jgi:3-methyladenine DNA glycosylase AlkD
MTTLPRSTRHASGQSIDRARPRFGTIKETRKRPIDQRGAAVLAALKAGANPKNAVGMAHFGIVSDGRYGLSVPALRGIAKEAGRDHDLALALWETGQPEARIIACMVEQAPQMTSRQADAWARDIDSWDVCDGFAYDLMSRTTMRWTKPAVWARSKHEFVRRAAFALIAGLAVHDKEAMDAQFIALLPLIENAADDDRNFVKKAVNWALRQTGKRNRALNKAAIACARRLRTRESRSARWIAAGALRELQSDAVQGRLRA